MKKKKVNDSKYAELTLKGEICIYIFVDKRKYLKEHTKIDKTIPLHRKIESTRDSIRGGLYSFI